MKKLEYANINEMEFEFEPIYPEVEPCMEQSYQGDGIALGIALGIFFGSVTGHIVETMIIGSLMGTLIGFLMTKYIR